MIGTGHRRRLWIAMVGRYLRQMDAVHRHRRKALQENSRDRASIQTDGDDKSRPRGRLHSQAGTLLRLSAVYEKSFPEARRSVLDMLRALVIKSI